VAKQNITKTFLRFCQGQKWHPFGTKDTADGPARRGQPITTLPFLIPTKQHPILLTQTNKQTNKQTNHHLANRQVKMYDNLQNKTTIFFTPGVY